MQKNNISNIQNNHLSFNNKKNSKLLSIKDNQINIPKKNNKALNQSSISSYNNLSNRNHYINLNKNIEDLFSVQSNILSSNIYINNKNNKVNNNENEKKNIDNKKRQIKSKNRYIKTKLFPYRYYLFSIFIKNIDANRNYKFITKKFIVVYNFICQILDISSYLILQKEFEIMKNTILMEKYREILENRKKINVNDIYFNTNMKKCLDSNNFAILGKMK